MNITQGDYFDNSDVLMEDFFILPIGLHDIGTYSLPSGMSFSDLERMEGCISSSVAPVGNNQQTGFYTKEEIAINPTGFVWELNLSVGPSNTANVKITAINNHQFTIARTGWGNERVGYIKGIRKRYITENVSAVVNVNNGADLATSTRYKVDIATTLGPEYLAATKLEVVAEIYNDGTSGEAGWGEPGYMRYSPGVTNGVSAKVLGGEIVIQTGSALCGHSIDTGNPFGNTNTITAAPCRLLVTKVDKMVDSSGVPSIGRTKTVLFETLRDTPITNTLNCPLNDDITNYDEIRIYANYSPEYKWVKTVDADEFMEGVGSLASRMYVGSHGTGNYVAVNQVTDTRNFIVQTAPSAATVGVYKVVGFKYHVATSSGSGGGAVAPVALTGALASAFSSSTGDRDSNYDPTDFGSTNYTEWWSQTKDIATYAYGESGLMSATPKTLQDVVSVNTLILVEVFSHKLSNHKANLSFELLDTYGNVLMGIEAIGANGKVTTRYGTDLANLTHTAGAESAAQFRGVIELLPDGVKFSPSFNHVPNEASTGNWYTHSFTRVLDTSLVRGIRIAECSANANGASKTAALLRTFPKPV